MYTVNFACETKPISKNTHDVFLSATTFKINRMSASSYVDFAVNGRENVSETLAEGMKYIEQMDEAVRSADPGLPA